MSADEDETPQGEDDAPAAPGRKAAVPATLPAAAPPPSRAEAAIQRLAGLRGKLTMPDLRRRRPAADDAPGEAAATGQRGRPKALPARVVPATAQPLPDDRAPALASQPPPARPQAARPAPAAAAAPLANAPAVATPVLQRPLLRRGRKRMTSSRAAMLSMTSQEAPLAEQHEEERDLFEIIEALLMRLMSVAWLVAAILMWGRLIGYGESAPEMSWYNLGPAFVPTLVAAIVAPIVSVGLWLVSSWGAVVWAGAVLLSLALAIAGAVTPPFGLLPLAVNLLMILLVGGLAGVRAWRDREADD